jgi:hypothetical protein
MHKVDLRWFYIQGYPPGVSGFSDMGFRHLGRFWMYRGNSLGGEPEGTFRSYGLLLVKTCTYDLNKLKWRHMPTGEPRWDVVKGVDHAVNRSRVSSEIEPRRV